MTITAPVTTSTTCAGCSTELAPGSLVCPACHGLVYADRLQELADTAEAATRDRRSEVAVTTWESALALLPPGSRQHGAIQARLTALRRTDSAIVPPAPPGPAAPPAGAARWKSVLALVSAGALAAWKLKFAFVFLATKGKLLLLGLTKSSTLLSMLASIGVYWAAWGLWFAVGFVLSIYIHEMGHVAALRRYGIPATAPMFIPGLGAFIRAQHMPASLHEQAQIGLAGPLWGLGAAIAAYAAFLVTGNGLWAAIAQTGALINVFNLVPVWQLDGSRAFAAFTRSQRWLATLAVGLVWAATREGLFVLVLIVAAGRAMIGNAPAEGDRRSLALFAGLVAAFAIIAALVGPATIK